MADPVLVEYGRSENQNKIAGLVGALQAEGLDARPAQREREGTDATRREALAELFARVGHPVGSFAEVVAIWLAATAGAAVVNQAVQIAVEWMRDRYRQAPDHRLEPPETVIIVLYEGGEGRAYEVVELESVDSEPTRRPPTESELYMRTKPSEQQEK